MENEKAIFFALYWGQRYGYKNKFGSYRDNVGCFHFLTHLPTATLFLKPLSTISDEDAIEVSEIIKLNPDYDKSIYNIQRYPHVYAKSSAQITDFLRSRGYALPFTQYSVDQQIELGWIKLSTNN